MPQRPCCSITVFRVVITGASAPRVFRAGDIAAVRETAPLGDRELRDPFGKGEVVTRTAFELLRTIADGWAAHLFRR